MLKLCDVQQEEGNCESKSVPREKNSMYLEA